MEKEDENAFAGDGDLGETEAVHQPHRDDDPPQRKYAVPAAWLLGIGLMVLLTMGLLLGWILGIGDLR